METRALAEADVERVIELAESAMTASFAMNPSRIEALVEERFGEQRLSGIVDDEDRIGLVVETDEVVDERVVSGFASATVDGETGTIEWLFVDPEHRGLGVGTELFERTSEALRDRGVEEVEAAVLEANTEGQQFAESVGLDAGDERRLEVGGESLAEHVYTTDERAADEESGETSFPETEELEDGTIVATHEGEELYVDPDDERSGDEGPFFGAYSDESHTDRFGYYCHNCGSLSVSMGNAEELECGSCGNTHSPRSAEADDESYL